ncbi:hypothetical protein I5M32_10525 [Pedobacter sp. SD-b]|uniref:Lipocalin-like domain-containing protein n=2 Tax=Pedobacter segetis TaxID=2793069 RepID=A0ABS1BM74_9SPHI|nr:hypothetical protein [Pedobacter segetis]
MMSNNKVSKGTISGTWVVNNVSLEGFPDGYEVKNVFDIAPYQDFNGSTWKLYGGYSGMITLPNGVNQEIYWSLINDGITPIFQFKKIDAGEKAKNVSEGYQLQIASASKTNLVLKTPFKLLNGNMAYIVYNFSPQ